MRRLCERIGMGEDRTGFALAKTQLAEYPLALPHAQLHLPVFLEPVPERFTIPQVRRNSRASGALSKDRAKLPQLIFTQPTRSPTTWALGQSA